MATIDVRLNAPQMRAWQSLRRRNIVAMPWGRGVGKSWFIRFCFWSLVAKFDGRRRDGYPDQRGARVVVLMPTLKQYRDVHGDLVIGENESTWSSLGGSLNKTTWALSFPGGSWVKPFPASEYNSKTARGLRCDFLIVDECDDVGPDVYGAVAVPWLSEPWSLRMTLLGGTPRRGRHGLLYKMHRAGLDADRLRASGDCATLQSRHYTGHATYRDSPETVDPDAVEQARMLMTPQAFAREWECDFDSAEGLVYPFSEDTHVKVPPADVVWSDILIAGDHGWEDPGVLLLIGVLGNGRDATAWVIDEVYERHQSESWWVSTLMKWLAMYPVARCYFDPSMPSRIKAFRSAGARVMDVNNAIEEGVAAVAERVVERVEGESRRARLYVHPRCTNTIWEFGAYKRKRDPRDPERFLETIEDRNNHAMDALRYAVFGRFGVASSSRSPRGMESRQ